MSFIKENTIRDAPHQQSAPQNDFGMPKNNWYEPPTPFFDKKLMESVPNHNHEYDDTTNRFCFYFTRAGPTLGGLRFPIPAPVKSDFRVSSQSSYWFFLSIAFIKCFKAHKYLGSLFEDLCLCLWQTCIWLYSWQGLGRSQKSMRPKLKKIFLYWIFSSFFYQDIGFDDM